MTTIKKRKYQKKESKQNKQNMQSRENMEQRTAPIPRQLTIAEWWPRNSKGEQLSVYLAQEQLKEVDIVVGRHSLTVAKEARLAKADIGTIVALTEACSYWANRTVFFEELLVELNER